MPSGRERRRNLSKETDNDHTDQSPLGGRALPRERPPHSTFAVAALALAVLAAVTIAVALAILHFPDIGTIYVTVT